MTLYTDGLKEEMVRPLIAPPGMSVRQLAAQRGVSRSQLWKWNVAKRITATKTGEKKWSVAEKLRVLGGGEAPLEGEAFGALLRREGLHLASVGRELISLEPVTPQRLANLLSACIADAADLDLDLLLGE